MSHQMDLLPSKAFQQIVDHAVHIIHMVSHRLGGQWHLPGIPGSPLVHLYHGKILLQFLSDVYLKRIEPQHHVPWAAM